MGPAGRGAPAAGCCSPHLPPGARFCKEKSQSHLEQGGGVEPEDARSGGAEPRRGSRRSSPRVSGSGTVGGDPDGGLYPGGAGWEVRGRRLGGGGCLAGLPLAPRLLSPQRVPTVYICIAPSLSLFSSPRRPDCTSVVSARGSVPSPSSPPPSSPPPFPLPLRVQPAAWIFPVLPRSDI